MKIEVQSRIGNTTLNYHIDEQDDKVAIHKAFVLGNPPQYCPLCKNNQYFRSASNKDGEGNIYNNIVCGKCGAKAKLGYYKTGGYFWHNFQQWKKEKTEEEYFDSVPTD